MTNPPQVPAGIQLVVLDALSAYLDEATAVCLSGGRDLLRQMVDLLGSAEAAVRRVSWPYVVLRRSRNHSLNKKAM